MCHHVSPCPDAASESRDLASVVSSHPEQGWSLLCNGVVLFDDGGEVTRVAGGIRAGRYVVAHRISIPFGVPARCQELLTVFN